MPRRCKNDLTVRYQAQQSSNVEVEVRPMANKVSVLVSAALCAAVCGARERCKA